MQHVNAVIEHRRGFPIVLFHCFPLIEKTKLRSSAHDRRLGLQVRDQGRELVFMMLDELLSAEALRRVLGIVFLDKRERQLLGGRVEDRHEVVHLSALRHLGRREAVLHLGVPGRKLLPVGRAAIMIADNVGELHKVSGTSHRAVVQVPEAAPKCNRV